jgi:excisionase family DNA binding protein
MNADTKLALRPREAAKVLSVSARALWGWTRAGLVPHVRIGKAILYPTDLLQEWLRQQAARQAAQQQAVAAEHEGQGHDAA